MPRRGQQKSGGIPHVPLVPLDSSLYTGGPILNNDFG